MAFLFGLGVMLPKYDICCLVKGSDISLAPTLFCELCTHNVVQSLTTALHCAIDSILSLWVKKQ